MNTQPRFLRDALAWDMSASSSTPMSKEQIENAANDYADKHGFRKTIVRNKIRTNCGLSI